MDTDFPLDSPVFYISCGTYSPGRNPTTECHGINWGAAANHSSKESAEKWIRQKFEQNSHLQIRGLLNA